MTSAIWDHSVVLVSGAAGTGKTTLLGHISSAASAPVAWYGADSTERRPEALLAYLVASLQVSMPGIPDTAAGSIDSLVAALHSLDRRVLLVLDDLHALESSPAEHLLARLIKLKPANVGIVAASRSTPELNLSRLRLNGELVEIGAEELRFRVWEVEALFGDVYRQRLGAEELAELTRRTNGWAAGLQLFHLATRRLSRLERRRFLGTLSGSSRLVREYLADNVVRDLPADLREFMKETSILRTLSAGVCDRYLARTGSARFLGEMERRNLLLCVAADECRVNEVLRSHLEDCLMRDAGEYAVCDRFRRAASVYEELGYPVEALHGFVRAHDELGVARLLAANGPALAVDPAAWMDLIPPALLSQDPWLVLGTARRHRMAGRWQRALELYQQAERISATETCSEICRTERRALALWLEKPVGHLPGWNGLVRSATVDLADVDRPSSERSPAHALADGVVQLLGGNVARAAKLLEAVSEMEDASALQCIGAALAACIARLLAGAASGAELEAVIAQADGAGAEWLSWLGRASLALSDRSDGVRGAYTASAHFKEQDDPWGESLAGLMIGLGAYLRRDCDAQHLAKVREARAHFERLGASALEAWCRCVEAALVASAAGARLRETALAAESAALSTHLSGPLCLVYRALAVAEPASASRHLDVAETIALDSGWSPRLLPASAYASPDPPPMTVFCFGEFRVKVGGRLADMSSIKPRARQLLRLLAMHFPGAVHREVIGGALWTDAPEASVRRSLQVAVSSVRRLFQDLLGPEGASLLVREGESYRLQLPANCEVDLAQFYRLQREGRVAEADGRHDESRRAYSTAFELYAGDLLADDGPAEWVVAERERCRSQVVDLAQALAASHLASGQPAVAAGICERAVRIDRFADALWRILLRAHRQAGNHAAEARARRSYEKVLSELGLAENAAI